MYSVTFYASDMLAHTSDFGTFDEARDYYKAMRPIYDGFMFLVDNIRHRLVRFD